MIVFFSLHMSLSPRNDKRNAPVYFTLYTKVSLRYNHFLISSCRISPAGWTEAYKTRHWRVFPDTSQ